MQNDLISCWTFTLSIYTRAMHGWSSMQTGPHTKQLKGTAVAGSHHQAALHACTALDCIQSCQHWCNCVTIWTPFSSLLPENWIANPTFFFPWVRYIARTHLRKPLGQIRLQRWSLQRVKSERFFSKLTSPLTNYQSRASTPSTDCPKQTVPHGRAGLRSGAGWFPSQYFCFCEKNWGDTVPLRSKVLPMKRLEIFYLFGMEHLPVSAEFPAAHLASNLRKEKYCLARRPERQPTHLLYRSQYL